MSAALLEARVSARKQDDEGARATGLVETDHHADAPAHGFWLRSRDVRPIEGFRTLVGLLLTLHFASNAVSVGPLPALGFLSEALAHSPLAALPTWTAGVLFAICAVLALGIALGIAVRACAALLLILNAVLGRALFQLQHLDDWLASVCCFWLLVLPTGRSWLVRPRGAGRTHSERVSGLVVSMLLGHVLAFYLNVHLWATFSPLWQPSQLATIAACLVPGLYLLPFVPARRAAFVLQLVLHGYLAYVAGEAFTHGLLVASGLLFWGERAPHSPQPAERPVVDLATAVAGCYSLALVLWIGALFTGQPDLTFTMGRVLEDLGLHPPLLAPHARELTLGFVGADGKPRAWQAVRGLPDASRLPTRILLTQIASGALSGSAQALSLAQSELRAVSSAYCAGRIPSERPVTITLQAPDLGAGEPYPIASFHCYDPRDSLHWVGASQRRFTSFSSPRENRHEHAIH